MKKSIALIGGAALIAAQIGLAEVQAANANPQAAQATASSCAGACSASCAGSCIASCSADYATCSAYCCAGDDVDYD